MQTVALFAEHGASSEQQRCLSLSEDQADDSLSLTETRGYAPCVVVKFATDGELLDKGFDNEVSHVCEDAQGELLGPTAETEQVAIA